MPTDAPVIELASVSKTYRRRTKDARSIRDLVRFAGKRGEIATRTAVDNLSLAVRPGEMVGLIGGNGAGKSTTLRLAAGLTRPTTGRASLAPESAAVLALGETFALDLTGRENAITSAVVAGCTPREARLMLGKIIEFAELEDAQNEPVRTYSEGMKLRLAFAVVAQTRPRALLLDEVMAVGDLSFQRRSGAWIEDARTAGCGLLIASHDLTHMAAKADRLIWLQDGTVRMDGPPEPVVDAYRRAILEETYRRTGSAVPTDSERMGTMEVRIEEVTMAPAPPVGTPMAVMVGDPVAVRFVLEVGPIDDEPVVAIAIRDAEGRTCCSVTTDRSHVTLPSVPGRYELEMQFDRLDLVPGEYVVEVGAYRSDWTYVYDLHVRGYDLVVQGPGVPDGLLLPPHRWVLR